MRWELWSPWYSRIAARLGLDRDADLAAAKVLNDMLPEPDLGDLRRIFRGRDCIVLGAGPSLDMDLARLDRAGFLDRVLTAANGATTALMGYRIPEVVVTDLDGNVGHQLEAWHRGSWIIVHAHGDNVKQVREFLPKLDERVIGTTQLEPFGKLFDFGGFTDGDRAAFMAHELGASKIYLAGMDLGSEVGRYSGDKDPERKRVKLELGKELLAWLASELNAPLVNLTSAGEEIPSVPRVDLIPTES